MSPRSSLPPDPPAAPPVSVRRRAGSRPRLPRGSRLLPALLGFAGALLALVLLSAARGAPPPAAGPPAATTGGPPRWLSQTGLYRPGPGHVVDPAHLAYTPQYPLWSDGTRKRRWLSLPPGTAIGAARSEAWDFPPGTRLWKEFGYGRPVETRMIERLADGSWRFSAYVWTADGRDAELAPDAGIAALPVADAPSGSYVIPSQDDCRACHAGAPVPVLGVSALQLSPDRDPGLPAPGLPDSGLPAPGGATGDLRALQARGWLRHLPPALLANPPRIAAASPEERTALGYLHANCGHCHHRGEGAVPVHLALAMEWRDGRLDVDTVRRSALELASRARPGADGLRPHRIAPGDPAASVLLQRMRSLQPQSRMPPLGTRVVDAQGVAVLERWIASLPPTPHEETAP